MTNEELADLREQHVLASKLAVLNGDKVCTECGDDWPCTVIRVLDEIEALRERFEKYYPAEMASYDEFIAGVRLALDDPTPGKTFEQIDSEVGV